MTRIRISSHNLYIERGRYTRPPIPRESRWCIYCYMQTNDKVIEDETHTLLTCPLYQPIKEHLYSDKAKIPHKIEDLTISLDTSHNALAGKLIHAILETNEYYTKYYSSQDFHNKTGQCILL